MGSEMCIRDRVSGKLYEELSFVMKKNVDQVKEIVEASLVEDV